MVLFPMHDKATPVYITMLGLEHPQPGTVRPEGYTEYQWIQTRDGQGILEHDGIAYKIGKGQGFLLPPGLPHSYYPEKGVWKQDWISFGGPYAETIFKSLQLPPFLVCTPDTGHISRLIAKGAETVSSEGAPVLLLSVLLEILWTLSGENSAVPRRCQPVIQYMRDNYSRDISLGELAGLLQVTPQHFCKLFSEETGLRPFAYLARLRVLKSKEHMMNHPAAKLEDIAAQSGFASVSYFCKVFKATEGISPARFRKEELTANAAL